MKILYYGVCTFRPHINLRPLKKNWVPKSNTQDFIALFRIWVNLEKNFDEITNLAVAKFENSLLWGLYCYATYKPTSIKKNWVPKFKTQDFMAIFRIWVNLEKKVAENDEFCGREI